MHVANFPLGKHAPQGERKTGLPQKEIDRRPMRFIGAIVFQREDELASRRKHRDRKIG